MALALALTAGFLIENRGAGDWSDLVDAIALTFVVASLLAVGLTYLLVRFVVADPRYRVALAVVGPPGCFLVAALLLWLL